MRKAIIPAFLLVLGSVILGATVLREPIAQAATPFTNVIVGNTSSQPVPVQVAAPTPITSGGRGLSAPAGSTTSVDPTTASAISIHLDPGISVVVLKTGSSAGDAAAAFWGPAAGGSAEVELTFTRPISFDTIDCKGTGGNCMVSVVGAAP